MSKNGKKQKPVITLIEKTDKNILMRMISSPQLDDAQKNSLYQYKNKIVGNGVPVNYFFSDMGFGRLYAEGSLSLQNFKKEIRHALADDTYTDIDMVNAHPTLIAQYCKKENIECAWLDAYVANRDAWLKRVMEFHNFSRNDSKKLILKLCYLGNYDVEESPNQNKLKRLVSLSEELRSIAKQISKLNRDVYNLVIDDDTKLNKHASVLSLIAQRIEHNCLMEAHNFFKLNGFTVGVLCFDGLMVEKNKKIISDDILIKCSEFVKKKTGYSINFEIKPMDQGFDVPAINCFVNDDKGAQENLFMLEDPSYFKYSDKKLHVFNDTTGQYSTDEVALNHYLIKHGNSLLKLEVKLKDVSEVKSYGRDSILMSRVRKFVEVASWDEDWLERTASSSLGFLLFKDGIYNMKTGSFTKGFDHRIVFHDRIPHNFPERNEAHIKYAANMSFNLMLDDPLSIIVAFARALAGDISAKKIFFCPGLTNAGKSKLIDMFITCFGGFIKSFNAECLANTSKLNSSDEASRNRWAFLVRFGRILFSNEIKMDTPLNGNSIKKMASGGDKIIGRNHHEGETAFVPHFTLFCMLNDIPAIDPMDDAVFNRLVYCEFNKTFVDTVVNPKTQVLADPNLREKMDNPIFIGGFIHLILDGYRYFLEHGQPPFDATIKESWTFSDKKDRNIIHFLRNNFEVTHEKKDFILVTEMNNFKNNHKQLFHTVSPKRFNDLVQSTFSIHQDAVGKDRSKAWIGIKRINNSNDDL